MPLQTIERRLVRALVAGCGDGRPGDAPALRPPCHD